MHALPCISVDKQSGMYETQVHSQAPDCALQDSRLHNGNGVFLHMVHMLQSSEDAPSQGLAADLIQAMLGGECTSLGIGLVPASAVGLTHTNAAFDVNQLLQLIIKSNHIKVCMSVLPSCHAGAHDSPAVGPFYTVPPCCALHVFAPAVLHLWCMLFALLFEL